MTSLPMPSAGMAAIRYWRMAARSSRGARPLLSRRRARSKALRLRRCPLHDDAGPPPRHVMTSDPGRISSAARFFYDIHRGKKPLPPTRSEEHTSELQSRSDLVCRLLLEKKKKK